MKKFTPKPWYSEKYGGCKNLIDLEECKKVEADAKLRAAAPDLLEALIMCINCVGAHAKESEPAMNAWLKAKQAIQKATL